MTSRKKQTTQADLMDDDESGTESMTRHTGTSPSAEPHASLQSTMAFMIRLMADEKVTRVTEAAENKKLRRAETEYRKIEEAQRKEAAQQTADREAAQRLEAATIRKEEAELAKQIRDEQLAFEKEKWQAEMARMQANQEKTQQEALKAEANLKRYTEQHDAERLAQRAVERQDRLTSEVLKQLVPWDSSTDPEAYLELFTQTLEEAKFPEERWIPFLKSKLRGRLLSTYLELRPDPDMPFEDFRTLFLQTGSDVGEDQRNPVAEPVLCWGQFRTLPEDRKASG